MNDNQLDYDNGTLLPMANGSRAIAFIPHPHFTQGWVVAIYGDEFVVWSVYLDMSGHEYLDGTWHAENGNYFQDRNSAIACLKERAF